MCGLITPKSPASTSRETTRKRSPAGQFAVRSWSLALRASDSTIVSSYMYRRSCTHAGDQHSACDIFLFWLPPVLLSLRTGGSPYSPGFVPVWCLPEQESRIVHRPSVEKVVSIKSYAATRGRPRNPPHGRIDFLTPKRFLFVAKLKAGPILQIKRRLFLLVDRTLRVVMETYTF